MMLHSGALDDVQILSPKTVALLSQDYLPDGRQIAAMTFPGMFSESGYSGVSFSLGCGLNVNAAKTRLPGSLVEYFWGGAAATAFWILPMGITTGDNCGTARRTGGRVMRGVPIPAVVEHDPEYNVVFMTKVIGSSARLTLRRDLRTLVYFVTTEFFL